MNPRFRAEGASRMPEHENCLENQPATSVAPLVAAIYRQTGDLPYPGGDLPEFHPESLRQIIQALPAAVYTTDAHGRITMFNQASVEFSGRVPELGKDEWCVSWKLYRADGTPLPHDQCPMAVALKENRAVRGEELIVERPDGVRRACMPYPTPLHDPAGKLIGAVNMLVDITEHRREDAARAQLAAIVESSDDAIISKDLNGIIITWNRGAERLFGYSASEAIGQSITILIPLDRQDEEPDILSRIRRGERIDHFETVRRRKDGTLLDISLTISPMVDDRGRIVGASKIARDITQRKRAEAMILEARDTAEAAGRAKDRFLAVLSHELRTPLSPVVLSVAAIEHDPDLPFHLREQVAMIRRNIDLETKLIDDLLDLSRITSGKMRLQLEPAGVNELLRHVVQNCEADIAGKKLNVSLDLAAGQDQIHADAARIQQVFWNLLRNAIKFTPEGGQIRIRSENDAEDRVRVQVSDSGVGIAAEALPRIFDAFEQGSLRTTRYFGGLGLGLAICKAVTEMHGGTIRAASPGEGRGAVFTVELPLMQVHRTVHGDGGEGPTPAPGTGCRVLLVEDHPDMANILAKLLNRSGYSVKIASSVAGALQLAGAEPFDVLISDIGLPDGTGYDLMERLRDSGTIKGIALSGYGMEEDMRRSREAGFVEHIVKPVNLSRLEAILRRLTAAAS